MYPFTIRWPLLLLIIAAGRLVAPVTSFAQSLLPMKRGMAVATCAALYNRRNPNAPLFVVGVIDLRNPPPALVGRNWGPPMYHGPGDTWTSQNLGQIFGVCIDARGNIYVTATTAYGDRNGLPSQTVAFGPGGSGAVYKLDGATGAISTFAQLPNTGPALGNICYDAVHDQFFVTNFEDGRIYRLSATGAVLSTFDPYSPDNGAPGYAPLGERPWGIGVYGDRVYYGIWWQNEWRQNDRNEMRSIGLRSDGEFDNDDRYEFHTSPYSDAGSLVPYSSPVSDIAFSDDGRMLVAERTMSGDASPGAHHSRVLEYGIGTGRWTYVQDLYVGNYTKMMPGNSAGGVDFGYGEYDPIGDSSHGCADVIWASGDALRLGGVNPDGSTDAVYGLARIPSSGNSPADVSETSFYIDLDGEITQQDKRYIGDVEVFRVGQCASTAYLFDTVDICGGDTVSLIVPAGVTHRWSPATHLSCDDCPSTLAFPDATVTYSVDVTDPAGGVVTYYRTIHVTPGAKYEVRVGDVDMRDPSRRIVPALLSPAPDPSLIERFVATIEYPPGSLVLDNGTPLRLQEMLDGTIAEGWIATVRDSRPGFLEAEFAAPAGGQYLRNAGAILRPVFIPVLNVYAPESPVGIRIEFPQNECHSVVNHAGIIDSRICGGLIRQMWFTAGKNALNLITDNSTEARIEFELAFDGNVTIEVFNTAGIRAALFADRYMSAGAYAIDWNSSDLEPGLYFVRMSTGSWSESKRLVVFR